MKLNMKIMKIMKIKKNGIMCGGCQNHNGGKYGTTSAKPQKITKYALKRHLNSRMYFFYIAKCVKNVQCMYIMLF